MRALAVSTEMKSEAILAILLKYAPHAHGDLFTIVDHICVCANYALPCPPDCLGTAPGPAVSPLAVKWQSTNSIPNVSYRRVRSFLPPSLLAHVPAMNQARPAGAEDDGRPPPASVPPSFGVVGAAGALRP